MFLSNIQMDLLILKTYYGQFTLTTKKALHIILSLTPFDCNSNSSTVPSVARTVAKKLRRKEYLHTENILMPKPKR